MLAAVALHRRDEDHPVHLLDIYQAPCLSLLSRLSPGLPTTERTVVFLRSPPSEDSPYSPPQPARFDEQFVPIRIVLDADPSQPEERSPCRIAPSIESQGALISRLFRQPYLAFGIRAVRVGKRVHLIPEHRLQIYPRFCYLSLCPL